MTDKQFLKAEDVAEITGRKPSYCYKLIRQLNDELSSKGYLVIRGQVQTAYFFERFKLSGGDPE